ncbi:hypothetical protein [Polluticaenibacter yanchengensis]|uniref:Uncharacterized protein n=1 Tax=Polluticaenibacter yanchengensis TaxID=3014562 RepID=A0ABT4UG53_9BACT|nr:hypothetical protein [Chitinophagaceae bacterium LY-5]
MDKSNQLKNKLEKGRQQILKKTRKCLIAGCNNNAILSHVLQQKPILKDISDITNRFYSIKNRSIFNMKENDLFEIKKLGINDCYKFPGFCSQHDNNLFKLIENHPIDLHNIKSLQLFSYRTVCLELRNKEIYLELVKHKMKIYEEIFPNKINYLESNPAELAIKDLTFYKKEFEVDLNNNSSSKFNLEIIELPLKRICFSSTLSIDDKNNPHTFEYDQYGEERTEPLSTSILNYFPYDDKSYLIIATHKKYYCNWTNELIKELKNKSNVDKILSDLLTYRLELWGISPEIFENIPLNKIEKFKSESHSNWNNYKYKITSDFNLFD